MASALNRAILLCAVLASLALPAVAAPPGSVKLPGFKALDARAQEAVSITLDSHLLALATAFLDPSNPEDAAAKKIVEGLSGIYVRSYSFDRDSAYSSADVDSVRNQLAAPTWQHIVEVSNARERENVDVYMSVDQGRVNGLVVITREPREFTVVNVVGSIDLQKLYQLQGKFGIPKLQAHGALRSR